MTEEKVLDKNEKSGHDRCEEMVKAARKSLKVLVLEQKMEEIGCTLPESFFACKKCAPNESIIGGFVTDNGKDRQVVVCEDNVEKFNITQHHVDRTVAHELVHAYDHCRAKVDWSNCLHVACSEIRAANLSGDCHMGSEFNRRNFSVKGQGIKCVKRRAILSVEAHAQCKDIATKAVEQVFDSCYQDRTPFIGKFV